MGFIYVIKKISINYIVTVTDEILHQGILQNRMLSLGAKFCYWLQTQLE